MKKIKNMPILILVLMLIFSIGFFISTKEETLNQEVKADIIGVSGEVINLTNLQGYQPTHYFVDSENQSTLQATKVEESKKTYYYNEEGERVSTYYALEGDSPAFSKQNSFGEAYYYLSDEMKYFASKGALYVQASAGVVSRSIDSNDFIEISISSGMKIESFVSTHIQLNDDEANPNWQKTNFIQVDPNSPISFSFTSLGGGNWLNSCEFEIYEPKLIFKIVINEVKILNESTEFNPGQVIKLEGSNLVVDFQGDSNYLRYYRNIFNIDYEITSGNEFARIIGDYLYINENIDSDQIIKIKAKSKKDSLNEDYIYSEEIYFRVVTQKYEVKIETDFTDPAIFYGEGEFYENKKITLRAIPRDGFRFVSWIINGEQFLDQTVFYDVKQINNIKCNFVKEIKVIEIVGETKFYDGTTNVIGYEAVFDAVESNHKVLLTGLKLEYLNSNAGEEKEIKISGEAAPTLEGENAHLYDLNTSSFPQFAYGTILPKDLTLRAFATSKIYGNKEEIIKYQAEGLIGEETLIGSLTREEGENVGEYEILIGDLQLRNTNYNINFISEKYFILPREIYASNLIVKTKTYDKTKTAEIEFEVGNALPEDDVDISLKLEFPTFNAGTHLMTILEYNLVGSKSNNYALAKLEDIYATILKKEIEVQADKKVVMYGEEDAELTYTVSGLLNGDQLFGELSREEGTDVGIYSILNSFSSSNYEIKFITNTYEITKRPLEIIAEPTVKQYGDDDPILIYSTINLVEGDSLNGTLTRVKGEDVGEYEILLGSLNNKNYEISFTPNKFIIEKRKITLLINIQDKIYDGTTNAEWDYYFDNMLLYEEITIDANIEFEDKDVGSNKNIITKDIKYHTENIDNYIIEFDDNIFGNIVKKDVYLNIDDVTKNYGEQDPEFKYYFSDLVCGEEIIIDLTREQGNDVGEYEILINDINIEQAKNYNIVNQKLAYLTILPKDVQITIDSYSKTFGDEDPIFTFNLVNEDELMYDDSFNEVFSGYPQRQEGEIPGNYMIEKGDITSSENYNIVEFVNGVLIIEKRQILVEVNQASKIYGKEDPEFTYTVENAVDGYDVNINLKREYGEDVGHYLITYNSLSDPRYEITFVQSKLTILPRDITIKADDMFKVYGNEDPKFTTSVTQGELQFSDIISDIETGQMQRENGENVGSYKISIGNYSLGENYNIYFESGVLSILPEEIIVEANEITKKYGNTDGSLGFTITSGTLKFSDDFEGSLKREEGEEIGKYLISIGDLRLNSNYKLTFIPAYLTIEKRPISIIADPVVKVYGEEDPELTYKVIGGLVEGDELEGELYRDKDIDGNSDQFEMAGKYIIKSSLNNYKYDITFVENYLTIKQREIFIVADDISIIYGEEEPELTYRITSGTILEGDVITGNIYRVKGNNVGKYDIRSNLTLGRNYKIVFTKGVFEIKPIDIYVKTYNYEKTYGEINPEFEYEITKGELLEGDKLLGGITKSEGEDVGVYKLLSAFNNTNYNVILTENYITIKPKDVYLNVSILDKVYNGDTVAYIKQAVVSGLIDENIKVAYDKENSARFVTSAVGNNIEVKIFGISLEGEKAGNYNLIYPEELYGNITNNVLEDEKFGVSISTLTNTSLTYGTQISVLQEKYNEEKFSSNKEIVASYIISLEESGEEKELSGTVTLRLEISNQFKARNNFYVYFINDDGETILLKSRVSGNYLEFDTDELGTFVILSDNELWLDISTYISIGLLSILSVWLIYYLIKRKIKESKKEKSY